MIGSKLRDRYELLEILGSGGMGVVYRAFDPRLERDVAIKLIPPTSLDRESPERFRREARLVARLDHPAIAAVHDFGVHDDALLFLVMPLIEGQTLRHHIRQRDLCLGDILEVGYQVAEALDYSHRHGVVHRDIKPENIMLSPSPGGLRVRVMDFGLARIEGRASRSGAASRSTQPQQTSASGGFLGTVAYMSPEQIDGRGVDGRSDLYGLAAALYELLCGDPPFGSSLRSAIYRIVHEPPASLSERGVELGADLDGLLISCLAKDPERRPQVGAELAEQLRWIGDRLSAEQLRQPVKVATDRRRRHRPSSPPLVGRQAEMQVLAERLEQSMAGDCQLVLLGGDVGSGKSRLLEELAKLARARQLLVLTGRLAEAQSSLPYHGLCELIQDYYRGIERSPRRRAVDLSDLADDLVRLFPVLGDLKALQSSSDQAAAARRAPTQGLPQSIDSADATAVFEVLARTLSRLGDGRGMVLLLEHLHAGDISLDALSYIVRRLGTTPTLIIGTYRLSEVHHSHPLRRLQQSFHRDARLHHLVLSPLDPDAFRQLLASCTPELPSAALVDRLYEASEGNPLFGLELLHALVDSGDLEDRSSSLWKLGEGIPAEALPSTIQQAVERRLDRLQPDHRSLLTNAAVLGRSFEVCDLAALLGKGDDPVSIATLDDTLDRLIDAGLLREELQARGDHLRFRRGVIADVLYRDLTRRRRRRLHRLHAEHLERRHAGRLQQILPQLLRHFSAGDVADKAVMYGLQLSRESLAAFSPETAMRAARTALEFVDEEAIEQTDATRRDLYWLLARSERLGGHLERALHEGERALGASERLPDDNQRPEILLFLAETAWQARLTQETRKWLERGIESARQRGSRLGSQKASQKTLRRLLTFAATLANLQGQASTAHLFLKESESLEELPDHPADDLPDGGVLVAPLLMSLKDLTPGSLLIDEAIEVAGNVYQTLLAWDADGNLVHDLASAWRSEGDHRRFIFELRPEVHFADKTPLTAHHVESSFRAAARRSKGNPVAAFKALLGHGPFENGLSDDWPGIQVVDDATLAFTLEESLPLFPVFLTDLNSGIYLEPSRAALQEGDKAPKFPLGTGPFGFSAVGSERLCLQRVSRPWQGEAARVDGLEFRVLRDSAQIAEALKSQQLDLGRDLAPQHLEDILRHPTFHSRRVETVKKNVYFVLWNLRGAFGNRHQVRSLAHGVLHPPDLVWRTLGRAAQPAVSFIPPGVLGHDAGRRRHVLGIEEAQSSMQSLSVQDHDPIRCVLHPMFSGRYRALCEAIFELWRRLGLEVKVVGQTMDDYQQAYRQGDGVDVVFGRWNADYEDPDNLTYGVFHSQGGRFGRLYSSQNNDQLLEEARQQTRSERRIEIYQQFEDAMERDRCVLPLFHDIDYRIVGPRVVGLRLGNTVPYVNYRRLAKGPVPATDSGTDALPSVNLGERHLQVPVQGYLTTVDPLNSRFVESVEITPNIFETLTRFDDGARVVPWLAERIESELGGQRYRIHLRPQVRFHDGRRLTSRDVRYTFERALRCGDHVATIPLLPIHGARALRDGQADVLAGLYIRSSSELIIDLEEPLASFPTLLTLPLTGIVAEGCDDFTVPWRRGSLGTGPFRVIELSSQRLVLERNPDYWREGLPRSDRLIFRFGLSSKSVFESFQAGTLSLASDLRPQDIESLRRDPTLAKGYRESPRLATYFLLLNSRRGPFRDADLRRVFVSSLGLDDTLRQSAGRLVVPAHGLVPPGLLGYEPEGFTPSPRSPSRRTLVALQAVVLPAFNGQYGTFWRQLKDRLADRGWDVEAQVLDPVLAVQSEADLLAFRWVADFPDSDGFLGTLLHSENGILGRFLADPEIDRLLIEARRESDPGLRHALYRRVEERVAEEFFVVPLFHEQTYRFLAPGVENFKFGLHVPEVHYEELGLEVSSTP